MGKRTTQTGLPNWDEAPDLEALVHDKRKGKRANPAKGRRRNRRYENRLLNAQVTDVAALEVSIESTAEESSDELPK